YHPQVADLRLGEGKLVERSEVRQVRHVGVRAADAREGQVLQAIEDPQGLQPLARDLRAAKGQPPEGELPQVPEARVADARAAKSQDTQSRELPQVDKPGVGDQRVRQVEQLEPGKLGQRTASLVPNAAARQFKVKQVLQAADGLEAGIGD